MKYPKFKNLLADSNRILIGVSGGADSMALLHMIAQERNKLNKYFKVLYVNHQINSESAAWANVVRDYCESIDMPYECVVVDISEWGNNQEQAARRSRYDAFAKQDCDTIVLAHHADDQVETFFLKLFRGAGPKGLRCMSMTSPCWFDMSKRVIRPLLEYTKPELVDYAKLHNVPYVVDPSNADISYDRNWIRNCLMPMIQERNEIADINIRKVAAIQDEAYSLMNDLARIDLGFVRLPSGELDWRKLKTLSLQRVKNLVMYICAERNLVDVSIHHVESFSRGLLAADDDSRNELRMREFHMYKRGKRIIID